MRVGLAAALAAGAALSAIPATAPAYRTGPPAAHTGGFGEPSCAACHMAGSDAAAPAGSLVIDAPLHYEPGAAHDIRVRVSDPDLAAAGFQLAVRFAEGDRAGRQAGTLAAADSAVRVVTGGQGVEYAGHTAAGTAPVAPGVAEWRVRWTAPAEGGAVVFHAAANAADDDDSPFGDRIHLAERTSTAVDAAREPTSRREDRDAVRDRRRARDRGLNRQDPGTTSRPTGLVRSPIAWLRFGIPRAAPPPTVGEESA